MSPAFERWVIEVSAAIGRWMIESQTVHELREGIANADSKIPFLSQRERNSMRQRAYAIARHVGLRRFGIKRSNQASRPSYAEEPTTENVANVMSLTTVQSEISKIANSMDRAVQLKAKAVRITDTLEKGRANPDIPVIFYLCTVHQKPAEGHKEWQGKLYVDRMWRATLESNGFGWLTSEVEKRIKSMGIHTVQWAMGGPVWLQTRPYCRHKFIPIPTHEALWLDLNEIKGRHPEYLDHSHRSMTREQAYDKQKRRRRAVKERIEKIHSQDDKNARRGVYDEIKGKRKPQP